MTRTSIFWTAAAVVSIALGVGAQEIQAPAPAAPPGPATGAETAFDRFDHYRDGKLTRGEVGADGELSRRFKELDVDNSGKLDSGEFARFEAGGDSAARAASPP